MAKKTGKVNRVVYIEADLDSRMKKASDVNWSAVASAAFERQLLNRKKATDMLGVVERLRTAERLDQTKEREEGSEFGRRWAMDRASPKELRRLEAWQRSLGGRATTCADAERESMDNYDPEAEAVWWATEFLDAITGYPGSAIDSAERWFDDSGYSKEQISSVDWLLGFIDGAVRLWREVEPQL